MNKFISFLLLSLFFFGITSLGQENNLVSDSPSDITVQSPNPNSPDLASVGFWYPAGTFPWIGAGVVSWPVATAWVGDTLYAHFPSSTGTSTTTIRKYTLGANSWIDGVALPIAKAGGTLTSCGGKLYYIGGGTSVSVGSTDVFEYNPATGTWTTRAPMPASLSGHGAVAWGDSVIFILGGPWTGSATNLNVHYYRVATNTWGTITNSLPAGSGRRSFAFGICENKLVVAAGYNTTFLKSVIIGTIGSSASSISWASGPQVPIAYTGLSRPGGVGFMNFFFVVGGERTGGATGANDTAYVFNASTNLWIGEIYTQPNPTSNLFAGTTAKAVNDTIKIFAVGGSLTGFPGEFNGAALTSFIIPVELTSFTASVIGNEVTLNWRTATEVNNYGFQIERNSGAGFVEVGFVPGAGTISEPQLYSFKDADLQSGEYSYRLKQLDFDGTFEYSSVAVVEVVTPSVFLLEQNYPNPFNPTTTIGFSLATDSKVSLKIFNALGQEVKSIVNGSMTSGFHEIAFDASEFNSGVYFYRIDATGVDGQNFTQVRKMILAK
jgi:Secretion system C-terminal sorting domain/Kelch motif